VDEPLDWVTDRLLAATPPTPSSLLFLLRRYLSTGRLDIRDALEHGLAGAVIELERATDARLRVQWLFVCAEAESLTDDAWMGETVRRRLPLAVESLEAAVRAHYEPGDGMTEVDLAGQLHYALALLDAFALTSRTPYAMLGEELCLVACRQSFDATRATFGSPALDCAAAHLLTRLAALHREPDYVAQAVVAPGVDYESWAGQLFEALALRDPIHPELAAPYGLALLEWFALRTLPN
jgi:hypothetical protein